MCSSHCGKFWVALTDATSKACAARRVLRPHITCSFMAHVARASGFVSMSSKRQLFNWLTLSAPGSATKGLDAWLYNNGTKPSRSCCRLLKYSRQNNLPVLGYNARRTPAYLFGYGRSCRGQRAGRRSSTSHRRRRLSGCSGTACGQTK